MASNPPERRAFSFKWVAGRVLLVFVGLIIVLVVVIPVFSMGGMPYDDFKANDMQLRYVAQRWLAENDIEFVLGQLDTEDSRLRSSAAQTIARFRTDLCSHLETLAFDRNTQVQYWALVGLKNSDCARRVEIALIKAEHPWPSFARIAREILASETGSVSTDIDDRPD